MRRAGLILSSVVVVAGILAVASVPAFAAA
jgi:hypothetical protein